MPSPEPKVAKRKKKKVASTAAPKPKSKQALPSQIPSKRRKNSRTDPKKKRKIDVRAELQKVAHEDEDEKGAEGPFTPGGPLEK